MSAPIYVNGESIPKMKAGEWAWMVKKKGEDPDHIIFACPCGGECAVEPGPRNVYLPVAREKEGNGWRWDGDWDSPTLTPSIQRMGGCNWHGYLTKGEFREV